MHETDGSKLLVYASCFSHEKRLQTVQAAARRIAKHLKIDFELKTFRNKFEPIYVYYKSGAEEPIPILCTHTNGSNTDDMCTALRNMMFVLSFHPKYSCLKCVRSEIMQFS